METLYELKTRLSTCWISNPSIFVPNIQFDGIQELFWAIYFCTSHILALIACIHLPLAWKSQNRGKKPTWYLDSIFHNHKNAR